MTPQISGNRIFRAEEEKDEVEKADDSMRQQLLPETFMSKLNWLVVKIDHNREVQL